MMLKDDKGVRLGYFYGSPVLVCQREKDFFSYQIRKQREGATWLHVSPVQRSRMERRLHICKSVGMNPSLVGTSGREQRGQFAQVPPEQSAFGKRCAVCVLLEHRELPPGQTPSGIGSPTNLGQLAAATGGVGPLSMAIPPLPAIAAVTMPSVSAPMTSTSGVGLAAGGSVLPAYASLPEVSPDPAGLGSGSALQLSGSALTSLTAPLVGSPSQLGLSASVLGGPTDVPSPTSPMGGAGSPRVVLDAKPAPAKSGPRAVSSLTKVMTARALASQTVEEKAAAALVQVSSPLPHSPIVAQSTIPASTSPSVVSSPSADGRKPTRIPLAGLETLALIASSKYPVKEAAAHL